VRLQTQKEAYVFPTRDISVSGIRLVGATPLPVGSTVVLGVGEFVVRARIVRESDDGFALAFEPTLRNRANIIRYIFSKHYFMTGRRIKPGKVALAIGARLLR